MRVLSRVTTSSSLLNRAFSASAAHSLAKMTVLGRLAAEPEVVTLSSGEEMVKYALATNHGPSENRRTSWWKIVYFPRIEHTLKDRLTALPKG